jgi:hypothetical protein
VNRSPIVRRYAFFNYDRTIPAHKVDWVGFQWIYGKVQDEYGSEFTTLQNVKTKKYLSTEGLFSVTDEKFSWVVNQDGGHFRFVGFLS